MISSVKKALELLKIFSTDQPELSLTEISKRMDLHKSSVFRILNTLKSSGFIEKDPLTKKYRLGLELLNLANKVLSRYDLRNQAGPYLEKLARKTGEIIHLSILDGNEMVYLEKKGQGQVLTVATQIGGRNPAHASAMGKMLLSDLSRRELKELFREGPLKKLTTNTITEIPKLLEELERVRRQGFALDDEETFPGIRCAAAPIQDRNGKTVAAISVTVPKQRMGKQRIKEICQWVIETARLISERSMGWETLV